MAKLSKKVLRQAEEMEIAKAGLPSEDQVFRLHDGWYCVVNRRLFGPWELREYAVAGMQTEQRRAAARR